VNGRTLCPDVSHIYRVWGIGAFIFIQVATTFDLVNEISLTLSFYPLNHLRGWGEEFDVNEKDSIISIGNLSDIRLL